MFWIYVFIFGDGVVDKVDVYFYVLEKVILESSWKIYFERRITK